MVTHLETRESKRKRGDLEVLVQFETPATTPTGSSAPAREILDRLKSDGLEATEVNMTTQEKPPGIANGRILEEDEFLVTTPSVQGGSSGPFYPRPRVPTEQANRPFVELIADAPWFPRKIYDLDKSSKRVLMYGTDLDADHPVNIRLWFQAVN